MKQLERKVQTNNNNQDMGRNQSMNQLKKQSSFHSTFGARKNSQASG
jgi:hypothetical protein